MSFYRIIFKIQIYQNDDFATRQKAEGSFNIIKSEIVYD